MNQPNEFDELRFRAAVNREKSEPGYTGDGQKLPGWLIFVFAGLLFWSGAYLFLFGGGFHNNVFNDEDTVASMYIPRQAAGPAVAEVEKSPVELGKSYFNTNCQSCHQATGLGLAGVNPPLVASEWVCGSDKRLGMIVLHGLQGPLTVKGAKYNGQMISWGASLNDKKIAYILTYIRSEWGNNEPAITPEGIAALRAETASQTESYTEAQLQAIPADASLPGGVAPAATPAAAAGS